MSIRKKFLIGLALLTAVVLCSTLIIMRSFQQIAQQRAIANDANELSIAALDFNTENFHTQLEVWEYAYAPNTERLEAFKKHANAFNLLFERLLKKADAPAAPLSIGSRQTLNLLREQVPVLVPTWNRIVSALSEQRSADEIRNAVFESERVFDNFHFNKNVDQFVLHQKAYVLDKEQKLATAINLQLGLVILLGGIMLAAFAGFYVSFSKNVLQPIVRFTDTADAVSRGEPVQVLQVNTRDEVGKLADAFGRMVAAVRFLLADADKISPILDTTAAKETEPCCSTIAQ